MFRALFLFEPGGALPFLGKDPNGTMAARGKNPNGKEDPQRVRSIEQTI